MASSSTMAPCFCTSMGPFSSSISASVKGAMGRPSCASSGSGPHLTCWLTSSIWTSGGGTSYSSTSLDYRSYQSQKLCSSSSIIHVSLVVITDWVAQRPYIHHCGSSLKTFAQCPKCGSGCLSLGRRDQLDRGCGGECKASGSHDPLGCINVHATPPSLHP